MEGLKDRFLEHVREEWKLVGRLISPNSGLQTFLFTEEVVEQAAIVSEDLEAAGGVNGLVEGELDSFDKVEGDGVFETAAGWPRSVCLFVLTSSRHLHQLETDICEI